MNKTKHVLVENELDEISKKVKLIPTKGLTKDLINGYRILKAQNISLHTVKLFSIYISYKIY